MPVTTRFERSADSETHIPGVDRHFYENQLGAGASDSDRAAAVAKDRARHKLILGILREDEMARANRSLGRELGDILAGDPTGRGRTAEQVTRSIDGVDGASLDNIKL